MINFEELSMRSIGPMHQPDIDPVRKNALDLAVLAMSQRPADERAIVRAAIAFESYLRGTADVDG